MTSLYDAQGKAIACTVIEAGPCVVTQVKTKERDGYEAMQLSFGEAKEKHVNKAQLGHFKKVKVSPKKHVHEFRYFPELMEPGTELGVDLFQVGDFIDVIGTSKGKGFQGVVKRHGFAGVGDRTHGQHNRARHPGSIGAASYPARVFKGMRMAGQMGNARVKAVNLKVLKVIPEKNILVVSGNVPGHKGGIVLIEK